MWFGAPVLWVVSLEQQFLSWGNHASLGWASMAGSRHVTEKIPFPSDGLLLAGPKTPLEVFTDPPVSKAS